MTQPSLPEGTPAPRQRVRWKDPDWAACYQRLRARIHEWHLHQAYDLTEVHGEHRMVFYGFWQVRRRPGKPATWWVRRAEDGVWQRCPTGPNTTWPSFHLMNGLPRQPESAYEWQHGTRLALARLMAADPFLNTQPTFRDCSGAPSPNSIAYTQGPLWRLWRVLLAVMTPRARVRSGSSAAKNALWLSLRKAWWAHFLEPDLMRWAARIHWRAPVSLQHYGVLLRHRRTVARHATHSPHTLCLLRHLPGEAWKEALHPDRWPRNAPRMGCVFRGPSARTQWLLGQPPSVLHAWLHLSASDSTVWHAHLSVADLMDATRQANPALAPQRMTATLSALTGWLEDQAQWRSHATTGADGTQVQTFWHLVQSLHNHGFFPKGSWRQQRDWCSTLVASGAWHHPDRPALQAPMTTPQELLRYLSPLHETHALVLQRILQDLPEVQSTAPRSARSRRL